MEADIYSSQTLQKNQESGQVCFLDPPDPLTVGSTLVGRAESMFCR